MEIFKSIKGFEGLYEISNKGNVKNLITNKILKLSLRANGYYYINLHKNKKLYNKRVNRLVAETFIPNPNNLSCVNHKNEIKTDNRVENLEWCDYHYNNTYNNRHLKVGEKLKGKKRSEESKRKMSERKKGIFNNPKLSKQVVAIDDDGNVVHEFASIRETERNGFKSSHVSQCCNGLRKTHGGYRWFFKEDWLKMQATQSNERVACGKLNIE